MNALSGNRYTDARRRIGQSVPTPDHYLPQLYCIALQGDSEPIPFDADGIDIGSIGMPSVAIGGEDRS